VLLLVVLAAAVVLVRRFGTTTPAASSSNAPLIFDVTADGDRGPGTLREALFGADAAGGAASVVIRVKSIAVQTPLPPVTNPHGLSISAAAQGAEIDASALKGAAAFDITGAGASITGITIRNCPAAAILVRAPAFHLRSSVIDSCDVGVEIAENATDPALEHNRFSHDRVGVRFGATNRNALVADNDFSADRDAGVWAVRGEPDLRDSDGIHVRDNRFSGERMGVVAGNVSILLERNAFADSQEAAIHLIGSGAVVRANRISGGAAMGIIAEGTHGAMIENNELDHLTAYGILVRGSASTTISGNRISNSGYGMGFVLGDAHKPSTAVDNTILSQKFHGIDVIGDSPVLRRNRVQSQALALHVEDFLPPSGSKVAAHPFLDGNNWGDTADKIAPIAAGGDATHGGAARQ
jgi:parallel beta-helix repeat protein